MTVQDTAKQERIAAKIAERNAKVLELVKAANGVVRDAHRTSDGTIDMTHLIEFRSENGHTYLCPGLEGKVFCLNPVLLDSEGLPYLDVASIGGNIDARTVSLEEACLAYTGLGVVVSSIKVKPHAVPVNAEHSAAERTGICLFNSAEQPTPPDIDAMVAASKKSPINVEMEVSGYSTKAKPLTTDVKH